MLKNKLIELVLRSATQDGVGVVDSIKRVTPRQAELAIDNLWADMLFLLLKDSQSIDFFCKSYDEVDIEYNRTSKEYLVNLPVQVCQLPMNKGIHLVRGVGSNRKFFSTTNEMCDMYEDSEIASHYDRTLYVLDGNLRLKLINFDYASHNCRKVQLKLIPSFASYSWSEDVPIPSGRITEFTSLVAKALFQSKKFLDTNSDGVAQ